MKIYMGTTPLSEKPRLKFALSHYDVKRWTVGQEQGKGGYQHLQWRAETGDDLFFEHVKNLCPQSHIEKAEKWSNYEEKEGHYWRSFDRKENLEQRYGKLTARQEYILKRVLQENDRQVVVWYDKTGGVGKSWFTGALWERKIAHFTAESTATAMVRDIASEVKSGGFRPIVIIDLPRNAKWTDDIYLAIERIKDGLIKDPRYESNGYNIRGVKVLVNTNERPKTPKLSADRWIIEEEPLS